MDTGAVVAITVQPANRGDTKSIDSTLDEVTQAFEGVLSDPEAAAGLSDQLRKELVTDKGYHSNAVLSTLDQDGVRTYISEPKRGRRNWRGKPQARKAVYGNRRRIRGARGKRLLRRRGELLERPNAHCYETGGMRRTHLRGHTNIRKRLLVHYAGFNLGLLMRQLFGVGKPRVLQGLLAGLLGLLGAIFDALRHFRRSISPFGSPDRSPHEVSILAIGIA